MKTTTIATTKVAAQATAYTHDGLFHADDSLSTYLLYKLLGKVTVCRTSKIPATDAFIFDTGSGEFDHHQQGGNGTRANGVPYAAAGLIWKKFGLEILKDTCNPELIWEIIDRDLVQGVDAIDNGAMPRTDYVAQAMTFSKIIASFNPTWDSNEDPDEAFIKAVEFAGIVFENTLANAVSTAKAPSFVYEAIEKSSNHIMILDRFVPWQEFVFASTNTKAADIQFVVYPSNRGGYNWQCVPDSLDSFGQRKPVPAEWKGLRGTELQAITGVKTASFCHPAGFIGGADTLEDALSLAALAVRA